MTGWERLDRIFWALVVGLLVGMLGLAATGIWWGSQ